MEDDNFRKTVILLCDISEEGTFGFVVNRPPSLQISDVISKNPSWNAPVYPGGPVQLRGLNFIHNRLSEVGESHSIQGGLAWGGEFRDMERLIVSQEDEGFRYKFFVGYSGWTREQLEFELKRKSWILSPLRNDIIFDEDGVEVWKRAISGLGKHYEVLLHCPTDPQLN